MRLHRVRRLTRVATALFPFVSQLWTCVDNRLFGRRLSAVAHYTTLLLLFGVAAFKNVHVAFLAVTLVSELSTFFYVLGKLQVRQYWNPACRCSIIPVFEHSVGCARALTYATHVWISRVWMLHSAALPMFDPACVQDS